MKNQAAICDSYFRHERPSFVDYPHLIVYPMDLLPDLIATVTRTVPRMWPIPSELLIGSTHAEEDTDWGKKWESPAYRAILRSYSGSGHFATQFGLFCDACVTDSELGRRFSEDVLDDPWGAIIQFVDVHRWIMVPDEHGVLFVIIVERTMSGWIEGMKYGVTAAKAGWSEVVENDIGAVECVGFMASYALGNGKGASSQGNVS